MIEGIGVVLVISETSHELIFLFNNLFNKLWISFVENVERTIEPDIIWERPPVFGSYVGWTKVFESLAVFGMSGNGG